MCMPVLCMHVSMCMFVCVCVHVCVFMSYLSLWMCVFLSVYLHLYLCVCVRACVHVCKHTEPWFAVGSLPINLSSYSLETRSLHHSQSSLIQHAWQTSFLQGSSASPRPSVQNYRNLPCPPCINVDAGNSNSGSHAGAASSRFQSPQIQASIWFHFLSRLKMSDNTFIQQIGLW